MHVKANIYVANNKTICIYGLPLGTSMRLGLPLFRNAGKIRGFIPIPEIRNETDINKLSLLLKYMFSLKVKKFIILKNRILQSILQKLVNSK